MLAAVAAVAAEAQPAGDESMLFEDVPSVFGASRYLQSVVEAPSSVTVISSDEIARWGWRTLAEILSGTRGFYATNDRNYTYLGVRGFGRPGDFNTRILLLVDGHRINETVSDGALYAQEGIVDVSLIERVEVIRGASSSLYGSNAFFAVVNVVIKKGAVYSGGEAVARAGSYGGWGGSLTWGKGGKSDVLVSGETYRSDGQPYYFPEFDDPATNNGRTDVIDAERRASAYFATSFGEWRVRAAYVTRDKQVPTASFDTDFNSPDEWTYDKRAFLSASYRHEDPARGLTYDGELAFDWYRYEGSYPYSGASFDDYQYGQWWTADGQMQKQIGRHRLLAGATIRYSTQQDQGAFDRNSGIVSLDDRRSEVDWGGFFQGEFHVSRRWLVNAGLRYDFEDLSGGTASPRVAGIWSRNETEAVKIMAGRSFRAPSAMELYYNDGGLTQKSPASLDPETVVMGEVSWERAVASRARFTLSAYAWRLDNLIELTTDPVDDLLVYANTGMARAVGTELELDASLGRGVTMAASWAAQRTENDAGAELSNSPNNYGVLRITGNFGGGRLDLGAEVRYVGTCLALDGTDVPGHTVADLTFAGRGLAKRLSFLVSVRNLLDEAYGQVASEEHVQRVIPQDGRNFRAMLGWTF